MMPVIADVIAPLERLFQILMMGSITGGIVVLVIAALCRFTSRISPAMRCALWWLAALKLIVALVWIEPIVLRVLPPDQFVSAAVPSSVHEVDTDPGRAVPPGQTGNADRVPRVDRPDITWESIVAAIWTAGVIIGLCVMLRRIRKTAAIVARAQPANGDITITVRDLCVQVGLRRAIEARWSRDVDAPMIVGLRRPVILLPHDRFPALSADEQRMAICHELVHLRRGDLWLGCVPALAERLFFFHPLAILAAREYLLAREAACDRAVLRLLDAAPQDYGRLLLSLGVSPVRQGLAAAGSSRSFSNLKRRIAMLGHRSPSSIARLAGWILTGAAMLAVVPIQLGARPGSTQPNILPPHLKRAPWADAVEKVVGSAAAPVVSPAAPAQDKPSEYQKKEKGRLEYILVNRDRHGVTMSGSWKDAQRIKQQYGDERVLWFRRDGKSYLVKDPAAIDEAEQINRPVAVIGAKQGEVGAKQGAIGAKQGAVGARQGEVGARQGAIGARQGAIGAKQGMLAAKEAAKLTDAERREIDVEREQLAKEMDALNAEMEKLGNEMRRVSEPMEDFGKEMEVLSKEMEGLSREMNEAVAKANTEMIALAERLIKSGVAQIEP